MQHLLFISTFFLVNIMFLDDQWLVAILRGCKFSLERVKAKLDLFYTLRTTAPEVTLCLKPTEPKFLAFLKLG